MNYRFYSRYIDQSNAPPIPAPKDELTWVYWRPSLANLVPTGLTVLPFCAWSLFHYLRVFSNRDYSVVLAYENGSLVHRSCVFPSYFRFPFMKKDDLQIGDVWTAVEHRGKGLGRIGLEFALSKNPDRPRTYWYLTESNNHASVRLAEKAMFELVGEGSREKKLGCNILGSYVIQPLVTLHC